MAREGLSQFYYGSVESVPPDLYAGEPGFDGFLKRLFIGDEDGNINKIGPLQAEDLATDPGLEFVSGLLQAKLKASGGIDIDSDGLFLTLLGTATNDDAGSGQIGEYVTANASGVSLTTATATNITSISLSAGDWDIEGVVNFATTAASASDFKAGSHSTSATFGGNYTWANIPLITTGLSDTLSVNIPTQRFSLSGTTTVYLIASANFSLGSISGSGLIRARRAR